MAFFIDCFLFQSSFQLIVQNSWEKTDYIFTVLPPSTYGHHYELRFRYYLWDTTLSVGSCESANFALAIRPSNLVHEEAALFHSFCLNNDVVPVPQGWNAHDNTTFHPISDTWSFTDNTIFSVRASVEEPHYFHTLNFEIKEKSGFYPTLHAEISYRFLLGDLALLLERGNQRTHCYGSFSPETDVCVSGSNDLNTNFIHGTLEPGYYTLWFYEPAPQNLSFTNCAPFSFTMSVTYTQKQPEVETQNCNAFLELPQTLNQPGLLDYTAGKTWLHLNEEYQINPQNSNMISFDLQQDVVFRIRVLSYQFPMILDLTGQPIEFTPSHEPEIVARLSAGSYDLRFIPSFIDEGVDCPRVNAQIMLYPASFISEKLCSSQRLPVLQNIRVPFQFGIPTESDHSPPTVFNAYSSTPVITEYSWTIGQTAFFEVYLNTHFLGAGLKLELSMTSGNNVRVIESDQRLNQHFIRTNLEPGTYHLKILRDTTTLTGFSPCAQFEFQFNLQPVDNNNDLCLLSGETLPNSLNSLRWLGKYDTFDYQASFSIPDFDSFYSHSIDFQVANESIFRVFSEPHAIDIDLVLYEDQTLVEDGGFGFNNEESIVWIVKPGRFYSLVLNM